MTVVARMLTQEQDGVPGYIAHPEGAGPRPELGFNVLAPSLFNMFGIPGTNQIGHGAELQAKHSDPEFLDKMGEPASSPTTPTLSGRW